jgi:O-antigen/teichoic acid export membrane protein
MAPQPSPSHAGRGRGNNGHSLKKNAFFAVLGNGVLNLCNLAVVALLAKFATPELPGTFTYASIALAAPVVLFCGLQLRPAYVADAGGEFPFGTYRVLRRVGLGLAALVLLAAVLWITRSEADRGLAWLMLAVCAGRVVLQAPEVYWGRYQRRERLDLLAWSNVLRGVLMLAPFAVVFIALPLAGTRAPGPLDPQRCNQIAAAAASCYVIGWIAVWWFFDRRRVLRDPDIDLGWSWPAVWKLARQTLPLGLVLLLINLCETVTQWFIKNAAGADAWAELGYFGALRVITLVGMFLVVQVSTAAGNRLAHSFQRDLPAFLRLTSRLVGLTLGLGVGLVVLTWLFGEWFLRVVYTPAYARYYPEFLILVIAQAVVLLATVSGAVTTHMRQFWIQVPLQVVVLLATTVAAIVLIGPADPVRGGAWTMLVRSITQAVLYVGCVLLGIRGRARILGRS